MSIDSSPRLDRYNDTQLRNCFANKNQQLEMAQLVEEGNEL